MVEISVPEAAPLQLIVNGKPEGKLPICWLISQWLRQNGEKVLT